MAEEPTLVRLVAQLANAKDTEVAARDARIAVEEAIIAATGFDKSEGQESYEETTSEGNCKLVLKQPVTTKVDDDAWVALRRTLDTKHRGRAVFVTKYSLDTRKARVLQDSNPLAWRDISSVITRKPGKISVEVKDISITTGMLGELGAAEADWEPI